MKTLIIGNGEIGKALNKVLIEYKPTVLDLHDKSNDVFGVMHICFGYNTQFESEVKKYQEKYKPTYTIIHSTVPVGTSKKLGALHSPVIGQHPHLEPDMRRFTKMIGGKQASEVADYFRRAGIKVMLFDDSETTEAAKIFLTEYYRACIEFCQRVKTYCDENDLVFHEVYTIPNEIYNDGYNKFHREYVRPILQPIMTPIGGHCVVPNSKLL